MIKKLVKIVCILCIVYPTNITAHAQENSLLALQIKPGYTYIKLSHFESELDYDKGSAQTLKNALKILDYDKGLVLDLRNNSDRSLIETINISEFLLKSEEMKKSPMIVLVNDGTTGTAEIIVEVLKKNKRGLILGTTSGGQIKIKPHIVLKYKEIEPDDKKEQESLKESGLENHLKAYPQGQPPIETEQRKWNDSPEIASLKKDNQIVYAIQILVAINIFENIKN